MYPNEFLFRSMLRENPNLEVIKYYNNTLTFDGITISLENLNLQEIYGEYSQLKNDISTIEPKDLFKIIQINAALKDNEKKKAMNLEENIEQVKEISPTIKKMNIIKKKNELGTENQYVHFVTSDGIDHILYSHTPQDVMAALQRLTAKNNNSAEGITEDDLYTELKRNMDDISLVDSHDALNNDKYSEDFQTKMKNMESRYSGKDFVLGSEEHDIYLAGHQATTFNTNESGMIQKEKHENTNIVEGNVTGSNDSYTELVDNVEKIDITNLISVEEYAEITSKDTELNLEEQQKVDFFQGFVFELQTYKDYLVDDGLIILRKYDYYMEHLGNILCNGELNNNQQNAYNNWCENVDRIEQVSLKNAKNKALVLEYKAKIANQQRIAGYVNSFLVIELAFVLSMTLSALIIYFFW